MQREETQREDGLIGYPEACRLLGIPIATLYNWVSLGRIPHVRFSKRMVRFDRARLQRWVAEREVEDRPPAA